MKQERELEQWLRRNGVVPTFQALADLLPGAAVVVTDEQRRVLYWSPEAERLIGRTADRVVGLPCPDGLVCDEEDEDHPFGAVARITRPDGTTVNARHYAARLFDANGPTGAVHALVAEGGSRAPAPPAEPSDGVTDFHGLLTRDPAMLRVLHVVRRVAETDATVLIRGESGTGKELVARALHLESRRRDGPFVAVNCAAFTPTLLESELFGHEKGAFTGAASARKGIFARADGGTLFLDEVAELSPDLQARLLRVLQERVFVPVGGSEPVAVDVRVVAATHRSLRAEVRAGRFREDLLFRLRVVPIFLPALRERPLDIEPLVLRFVEEFNARGPRRVTRVSAEALRLLLAHAWPGNVRELRNAVEYAFAVGRGPTLDVPDLPPELGEPQRPSPGAAPAARSTGEDPTERVRSALEAAGGDLEQAAAMLGVSRTTFWRMRRRAGV